MFAKSKEEWFRSFLDLPNGIPSHDTLRQAQGDVFSRLDPEQFQRCFVEWTQAVAALLPGEVMAIDGKTVCRSHDRRTGRPSNWSAPGPLLSLSKGNTVTLGKVKKEEKSNEVTAITSLLEMLKLGGCLVTIDAMGCLKEIAQGIVDHGASTCWR